MCIRDRQRVPYTDYEPQARGGKGVKTFYYQKSGSNGTRIAGVALITAPGQTAVSYTHLDVYKRQRPPCARFAGMTVRAMR